MPHAQNWFDQQRFFELLICSLAIGLVVIHPPPLLARWSTLILLVSALSLAILAPQPGWALNEPTLVVGLLAVAYWITQARQERPETFDRTALFVVVLLCLLMNVIYLMRYGFYLYYGVEFQINRFFEGFSNHRFFTQAQVLTLPLLALPLMLRDRSRSFEQITLLTGSLYWSLAFLAGTRGLYVSLLATALIAWIFFKNTGRTWAKLQIRMSLLGFIAYVLIFMLLPWALSIDINTDNARLKSWDSATDSSGRLIMWAECLRLIREHPWLGIGPMQFAALPDQIAAGAHNLPLMLMTEWGIPVALALMGMLIFRLKRFIQQPIDDTRTYILRNVLALSMIACLCQSLFEGNYVPAYTQMLIAALVGWAWGMSPAPTETKKRFSSIVKISNRILLGVCACYLVWLAIYPLPRMIPHAIQYMETTDQVFKPRFWFQGLINLPYDDRYPALFFKQLKTPGSTNNR